MIKIDEIFDKTREEVLPRILSENKLNGKGVEIGVFKGEFSKHILDNWDGKLYLIDPWRGIEDYIDASNHHNHPSAYVDTMNSISGYEDRAIMIRCLSSQAIELFENESLDFVYIDGNHAYDYVKKDIELWFPKLKKGGLFSGHDYLRMDWEYKPEIDPENRKDKYMWMKGNIDDPLKYAGIFGVNPAVEEFCGERGIKFYITSEWTSSWMFFK
jgi:hypothetical protein